MTTKNEFALAFNEVLEEKQLAKDVILGAIESAMVSAYRRTVNASTAQHVEAKVDPDTGKVTVFAEKEVVEDVLDDRTEVLLDVARQVNPDAQLGDMVVVETTLRIARGLVVDGRVRIVLVVPANPPRRGGCGLG